MEFGASFRGSCLTHKEPMRPKLCLDSGLQTDASLLCWHPETAKSHMAVVSIAASPVKSHRVFTWVSLHMAIWLLVSREDGQSQTEAPWKRSMSVCSPPWRLVPARVAAQKDTALLGSTRCMQGMTNLCWEQGPTEQKCQLWKLCYLEVVLPVVF